ncbi:hypothetical protein HY469_01550 [Candidatus Roizmanbacteria bacterium]|nr:hypothetical protein [Candidatus Roizmanbacteria bacterium]
MINPDSEFIHNPFEHIRSGSEASPYTIDVAWRTKIDEEQLPSIVNFFGQTMRGLHCIMQTTASDDGRTFRLQGEISTDLPRTDREFNSEILFQLYDQTALSERAVKVHRGSVKALLFKHLSL